MFYQATQDSDFNIEGISIVSSGHIYVRQGRMISQPHGREEYNLFYIAKGRETFYLDQEVVAEEGAFIFYRPNEKQSHAHLDSQIGELYHVYFNGPEAFDLFGFQSSVVYNTKPSPQIHTLFEELIFELQLKQRAYEKIAISKLFCIFALLERNCQPDRAVQVRYEDKMNYVIEYINKSYYENHSLEEYAGMCDMSKYHFLRTFKSITGIPPLEYRNRIRLDHAKELLETTTDSIGDVAGKTGYSSNAYFCDAFKKKYGVSPVQYRKRIKNKPEILFSQNGHK